MAKKLRVGDTIRGYRVTKVFGPGMMAISYGAEAPGGEKVFLKQYKSPSPAVVWYRQFVDYQQELSSRVRNGKAAHYAVRLVDAFEETMGRPHIFRRLRVRRERPRPRPHAGRGAGDPPAHEGGADPGSLPCGRGTLPGRRSSWPESPLCTSRRSFTRISSPANAYLIKDPSLGSGYQLKLIDTDFSVLADRRAPWHGYQGYVGTDNYRSIEHMTRGAVPILASDIFTCGSDPLRAPRRRASVLAGGPGRVCEACSSV